jgi:hypothetical protein
MGCGLPSMTASNCAVPPACTCTSSMVTCMDGGPGRDGKETCGYNALAACCARVVGDPGLNLRAMGPTSLPHNCLPPPPPNVQASGSWEVFLSIYLLSLQLSPQLAKQP